MLDLAAFRVQCPEFAKVADAKVTVALAQAQLRTSVEVFGDLVDEAHKWLTCHILASNPQGREAALSKTMPGETIYSDMRRRVEHIVGAGWGTLPDA